MKPSHTKLKNYLKTCVAYCQIFQVPSREEAYIDLSSDRDVSFYPKSCHSSRRIKELWVMIDLIKNLDNNPMSFDKIPALLYSYKVPQKIAHSL